MNRIKIGNKYISNEDPCFIIAEIGANHNNDINNAFKLIDLAVKAGADAVKFQSYKAETLYSRHTPTKKLKEGNEKINLFDLIKKIEMPYEWHAVLKKYCDEKKIIFISSPFDFEAVDSLAEINSEAYKIASSEIGDKGLVQYVAMKGRPIIISSGKATVGEIEQALEWIYLTGNKDVVLLHCTSSYPAKYSSMNLNCIETLGSTFKLNIGLSDHNAENITAVAAVALGAKVVEKHITLDKNLPGPDHHFALEPDEFTQLVRWIRNTELSLGDGIKRVDSSELEGRKYGNRSIHVKESLTKGHVLKEADLIVKRPAFGIEPKDMNILIGRELKKDIQEDKWITWDDV